MARGPSFTAPEIQSIRNLFGAGKTLRAVAELLGRATSAIQRQMKIHAIKSQHSPLGTVIIGRNRDRYMMIGGKYLRLSRQER